MPAAARIDRPHRAAQPACGSDHRRVDRRLQTWLLTGPVGHFVAGALDFAGALTRYALARRTTQIRR